MKNAPTMFSTNSLWRCYYALLASCYHLPSGPFSDDSIAMADWRLAMRTLDFKPKHIHIFLPFSSPYCYSVTSNLPMVMLMTYQLMYQTHMSYSNNYKWLWSTITTTHRLWWQQQQWWNYKDDRWVITTTLMFFFLYWFLYLFITAATTTTPGLGGLQGTVMTGTAAITKTTTASDDSQLGQTMCHVIWAQPGIFCLLFYFIFTNIYPYIIATYNDTTACHDHDGGEGLKLGK